MTSLLAVALALLASQLLTPIATPQPITPDRSLWTYPLPARLELTKEQLVTGKLILIARSEVRAVDTQGRLLWVARDHPRSESLFDGQAVVYDNDAGQIVSRDLKSGRRRWTTTLCKDLSPYYSGVSALAWHAGEYLVGCFGGRVARIDAATGRVVRKSDVFQTQRVNRIDAVGDCAFALSGVDSGAAMVTRAQIVDCRDLKKLSGEVTETNIVGVIGDTAIFDDRCCWGRDGVYRPATIYRQNLLTGKTTPEIDLTPEPERYPAAQRPLGQGSMAFLQGRHLMLAVDHALYDYGDALGPLNSYHRVTDNYAGNPSYGYWRSGPQIDRITNATVDAPVLQNVAMYTRVDDHAKVTIPRGCWPIASTRALFIALCAPESFSRARSTAYLAAYRWKH